MFNRKKRELEHARRERERSEKRLAASIELRLEIQRIRNENHFAEAIVDGLTSGRGGHR